MRTLKKIAKWYLIATVSCAGLALMLGVVEYEPPTPEERQAMAEKRAATKAARAAREAEERCTGQRSMAFAQTQDHVRRRLRAPSTAKFPWSDYHVTAYRDCTYEVLAHVDAQNGFGAMVRTNYVARMKVDPNTDRWTLLELNLL